MAKHNFNDLYYFVLTARIGSFTQAAAQSGISQSALSQVISNLEKRLNVRLITRTTRSLRLTNAGESLLKRIGHHFDCIANELDFLNEFRDRPSGKIKITCGPYILRSTLLPKLSPFLRKYPDIQIEFDISQKFKDIVKEGYDAGVRLGEAIDKDMIALSIGPQIRMAAVASPEYFKRYPAPVNPHELSNHQCINLRMMKTGGLYVWDFDDKNGSLNIRVEGKLIFNTSEPIVDAALAGLGIAFLPEDEFGNHIQEGRLIRVLEPWCKPFPGYYLYYPSRKQPSLVFSLMLEALRSKN